MKLINILLAVLFCVQFAACDQSKNDTNGLSNFPDYADPQTVGRKLTERFLSRPFSNTGSWYSEAEIAKGPLFNHPVGYIVYPDVCAWYGALTFSKIAGDAGLSQRLVEKAERIFDEDSLLLPVPDHVDNNVFGAVPLEVYIQNGDVRFLDLGLSMADEQYKILTPEEFEKLNENEKRWYNLGLSWQTRMWIDDMYMVPILQVQAFRATGDTLYISRAARQMVVYLDELQKSDGLFYHADNVPIYWGRGNGWVAAGMAELLAALPENHLHHERIMEGYLKMMATLLEYQNADGMWHQIVDDPDSWKETSCTGMFAYAFITGVKRGWLNPATYAPAARKAWIALCSYINEDGDLTDICEGTNKKNDYQYYLDRRKKVGDLHGQAPVLWCASALMEE